MLTTVNLLKQMNADDSGQDMIEYSLLAALVGLAALGAIKGLSNSIANTFNGVGNQMTNAV